MPIDFSLLNTNAPSQVGQAFDQNAITTRNNKMAEMAQEYQMRQQQQQMQALQLQQAQQGAQDEAATREAYKSAAGNPGQASQTLFAQGQYKGGIAAQQAALAAQKAGYETAIQRNTAAHDLAGKVYADPANWQNILTQAQKNGSAHPEDIQHLATVFSSTTPDKIPELAGSMLQDTKAQTAQLAEQWKQSHPTNVNPEKIVDENRNMWLTDKSGKIVPAIDPSTGKQMKAQVPASMQLSALSSDPGGLQSQVDRIGHGAAPFPTSRQMLTPAGKQISDMLAEQYPNIDATVYPTRQATERGFSVGKQGDTARAIGVSFAHMATAERLAKELNNGNIPAANALFNTVDTWSGKAAPTNFGAVRDIVADEIIKGVIGGTQSQADREKMAEKIKNSSSPEQFAGVMDNIRELLIGQHEGLRNQYMAGTSGYGNFAKFTNPAVEEYRQAHGYGQPKPAAQTSPSAISLDDYLKSKGH